MQKSFNETHFRLPGSQLSRTRRGRLDQVKLCLALASGGGANLCSSCGLKMDAGQPEVDEKTEPNKLIVRRQLGRRVRATT